MSYDLQRPVNQVVKDRRNLLYRHSHRSFQLRKDFARIRESYLLATHFNGRRANLVVLYFDPVHLGFFLASQYPNLFYMSDYEVGSGHHSNNYGHF